METNETDLDLWSGISSQAAPPEDSETAQPDFKTTRHGFDRAQVNGHLARMTRRLQDVEGDVDRLRSEVEQARRQLDEALRERDAAIQERDAALRERPAANEDTNEQMSGLVMELMVALNREVEKLRGEAQGEADHILDHARGQASRIRSEAQEIRAAADLGVAQAREEAERAVGDLTAQREAMVANLRLSFAHSLETIGSLASSIGGESEALRQDGSETDRADSSTSSKDDQATPLVVLPEIGPDRSSKSG